MRTLGLLGGMSWESTIPYYRLLNEGVRERCGGLRSAPLLLWSFDFGEIAPLQEAGDWPAIGDLLDQAGLALREAGAEALLIGCNTQHKLASRLEHESGLPVLHIAEATGRAIRAAGLSRVGLLGTRYTMEDPEVVRAFLEERFGLRVDVPDTEERARVHQIIYEELALGDFAPRSKRDLRAIVDRLLGDGVEGVILGCTELPLILPPAELPCPAFDTLALHAAYALDFITGNETDMEAPHSASPTISSSPRF